jgi:hypothetical protein
LRAAVFVSFGDEGLIHLRTIGKVRNAARLAHRFGRAAVFWRLRSGPFEGPATESLRLCRRIVTGKDLLLFEALGKVKDIGS